MVTPAHTSNMSEPELDIETCRNQSYEWMFRVDSDVKCERVVMGEHYYPCECNKYKHNHCTVTKLSVAFT